MRAEPHEWRCAGARVPRVGGARACVGACLPRAQHRVEQRDDLQHARLARALVRARARALLLALGERARRVPQRAHLVLEPEERRVAARLQELGPRFTLKLKSLQGVENFILKIIQLFETLEVRFGCAMVGPTGGGKTRVGAAAIAEWVLGSPGHRCLFIVNRRSLLLQTRSALLELGFGRDARSMALAYRAGPDGAARIVRLLDAVLDPRDKSLRYQLY